MIGPPQASHAAVPLGQLQLHLVGERDAVLHRHLVERAGERALHAGAVVAPDPDDQRVVELAQLLDGVDDPADVVVGVLRVAGVDLHLPGVEGLAVVGERRPRPGNASSRGVSSASAGITPSCFWRAKVSSRSRSQPWSNLPLVLVGPLRGDVVRRVAAPGGEVGEERLARVLAADPVQPLDGLVGHGVRQVVRVLLVVVARRGADDLLVLGQAGVPLARAAAEEAVEVVEAPAVRPAVERPGGALLAVRGQVPLPERGGAVAVVAQDPRQRRTVSAAASRCSRGSRWRTRRPSRSRPRGCCGRSAAPPGSGSTARSHGTGCSAGRPRRAGCSSASGSGRRTCSGCRTPRHRSAPATRSARPPGGSG